MKEIKEIGAKIAENEDEAFWLEVKKETEAQIKSMKKSLKFQKAVLEMSKEEAKKSIKNRKI